MNRLLLLIVAGLAFSQVMFAQNNPETDPRPLYPNTPPAEQNGLSLDQVVLTDDVLTRAVDADYFLFRPDPATATGQAVVICPGGGYNCTCYSYEGRLVAQWFQKQGVLAVVLRYRMPNGHSQIPLADTEQAIRMVRDSAAQWHIDPTQVGILGFSAGGHLAATTSTLFTGDDTRPDFSILVYPVITMDPRWTHLGSRNNLIGPEPTPAQVERYSLEKQVTDRTPPTFLVLCSTDQTVPPINSVSYYQALLAHGVPAELHIFPEGPHGFGWKEDFHYHNEMTAAVSRWLKDLSKKHHTQPAKAEASL